MPRVMIARATWIAMVTWVFLAAVIPQIDGYKYQLNSGFENYLIFSEKHMFATKKGPPMLEQGQSHIEVNVLLHSYSLWKSDYSRVGFAVYAVTDEDYYGEELRGICGSQQQISTNKFASYIENGVYPSFYIGEVNVVDSSLGLNGTYYKWTTEIIYQYTVRAEAWHNVLFSVCGDESNDLEVNSKYPIAQISGEVEFRNPYGYIPGELYGILPFEAARMVAYVLFLAYFMFFFVRNFDSVLLLHKAFLGVFMFALVESIVWYAAYEEMNLSGEPNCCPFPPLIVGALVLQVVRQTCARTLLLVIALGYGIVRPQLMNAEWIAISVVSCLYFAAAAVAQAADIMYTEYLNSPGAGGASRSILYQAPEAFMDVVFLTWIYMAIGSTIRILKEFHQSEKLKLYNSLLTIIGVFVLLFVFFTMLITLGEAGIIPWPWQLAWIQSVLWESLNFVVLAAVCVVCRPAPNSRLLAYASQLPTEDPDDDPFDGADSPKDADSGVSDIEMVRTAGAASDPTFDLKTHGYNTLPEARDGDQEYGLGNSND